MTQTSNEVEELWRTRPKNRLLRISLWLFAGLILVSWLATDTGEMFTGQTAKNLRGFLRDITPYPLQGQEFDWTIAWSWFTDLMAKGGWHHAASTLSISILAAVFAKLVALLFCWPAARTLATPEPWNSVQSRGLRRFFWHSLSRLTRLALVLARSLPEYILAFLFVAMFGYKTNPWPAILALAIHNSGILGRLFAETIENTPPRNLAALRTVGASRKQIAFAALLPQCFARFLLYFFYRWENCIRDATVLGMLGIASLGFLIDNARVALRYDEMIALVLVGAAIVIAGDLVSAVARSIVRRA